uniref:LysM domain-containing protein n=1 Tax=Quercus lobata TaxID=97700 RepID=A0A7N2MC14_QUELO
MASKQSKRLILVLISIADAASWCCALVLVALILLSSFRETDPNTTFEASNSDQQLLVLDRPCDEIYVVREGETLHTISDKCGDPYIVERNPHIHDPDDVYPGLLIKITPSNPRKMLSSPFLGLQQMAEGDFEIFHYEKTE